MIFGIVTVAHLIDTTIGEAHLFRDTAIFFYLSNEFLSLIENAGRIGAPIPPALQKAVDVLRSSLEVAMMIEHKRSRINNNKVEHGPLTYTRSGQYRKGEGGRITASSTFRRQRSSERN